jgi:hypothetical protein
MFKKITVIAVLLALMLASFPMSSVFAKDLIIDKMESKWDQLVDRYNTQSVTHERIHKQVTDFIKNTKNLKAADKAELDKHLAICNSALATAKTIVANHAGFDAKGNVVDRAVAAKTLDTLANVLQRHVGSIKNLNEHMKNR